MNQPVDHPAWPRFVKACEKLNVPVNERNWKQLWDFFLMGARLYDVESTSW